MGKLADELLRFDKDAEQTYATIVAREEEILRQARESALKLVQGAERTRGKAREDALREHETTLHRRKESLLADARREADRLRTQAREREPHAAEHLLDLVQREASQ